MKKSILIPTALFAAVFCISLFCQRYTLIFRENIGLFLLTPDWLREIFTRPLPLSNFVGSFLGQFYAEPIVGPMIPAAIITVIYLCLSAFLSKCKLPVHRLAACVLALTAWCFTASLSTPVAITAIMLICLALALIFHLLAGHYLEKCPASQDPTASGPPSYVAEGGTIFQGNALPADGKWWEIAAALVLIIGVAVFVGERKSTGENEDMAKVVVNAGKGEWAGVLKVATPEKVMERPLMMPFALLALNGQVKLGELMFSYPVSGVECLDLAKEKNAMGNLFQSYLFETMGVPNEAIHQMFQFSTNFDHGMTHLSLRRLIRFNIDAGNYKMAVKYAGILRNNLYYRAQANRIIKKYDGLANLTDSLEVHSSVALALTQDATYDLLQIFKCGHNSPVVIDRLLAYLLLECSKEDFLTIFYSYDWHGKNVPKHYQEALLLFGDVREGVAINPETARKYNSFMTALASMDTASMESMAKGTYWEYYYKQAQKPAENEIQ